MIRKWLTVFFSLMLAVMLPLAALADTQHTLSIVPGDLLASEEAVADFLDAFSMTLTAKEQSGALSLNLQDTAIAGIGLRADVNGLYVYSDLLSDDVLYITWDDGFAVLSDVLQSAMADAGADAAELEATMAEIKTSIVTAVKSGAAPDIGMQNKEDILAQIKEIFPDDPAMVDYIEQIYSKLTEETGEYTSEAHDAATIKQSMTMTNEELLALCDTAYMRTMMETMIAGESDEEMTEAELSAAVEEALEEVREMYRSCDMHITMDVYSNEGDALPVSMTLDMTMFIPDEDETETVGMKMAYNRLTDADGVSYKGTLSMSEDEEALIEMLLDLNCGFNSVTEGQFSVLADGEEITLLYHAEEQEMDVRVRSVALYLRSDAVSIIPPAASDRPLIALNIVSEPADSAVLQALATATPESSVEVMKLSAEDMDALTTDISTRCMQTLYTALANLPASVLNLMMDSME